MESDYPAAVKWQAGAAGRQRLVPPALRTQLALSPGGTHGIFFFFFLAVSVLASFCSDE